MEIPEELLHASIHYPPVILEDKDEVSERSGDSGSSEDASSESLSSSSSSSSSSKKALSSSSSSESLRSLAQYMEASCQLKGKYSDYATSYITPAIPSHRIYPDDTNSHAGDPPPFKTNEAVKIEKYSLEVKRRKQLGESTRVGKIIPRSKYILKEIQQCKITEDEDRKRFLYFKARQWCEVNKALYVDYQYPKISPRVIRDKYSQEYRSACKLSKKEKGLRDKDTIFKPSSINTFPIPLEVLGMNGDKNKIVQDERLKLCSTRDALAKFFENVSSLVVEGTEAHWQLKALETSQSKKTKAKKKAPFKRTEYPPKSSAEKIADLRKLLPPLKPEHLETDYLSGIWEPELMNDEFNISPINYDSRLIDDDQGGQIDWFVMQGAKQKCKNWLDHIPDQ